MAQALAGLRVLDLTHHIAGPYCTKLLSDYGADVLKVERPGGDIARGMGPFAGDESGPGRSGLFQVLNGGKRSVVLDLRTAAGRGAFERLAADADLVVESFRPGVLASLGFPFERLVALNPAVSLVSISNFGQTGPYRDFAASDLTLFAIGAELHSSGMPGRAPTKQHGTSMLYQSGAIAAGAALAAAIAAKRDGAGQWVDVAITETHTAGVDKRSEAMIAYQFTHRLTPRVAGGGGGLPGGVYPCKDGYFEIDVLIRDWSQVVTMLGEPEALKDPRFWRDDASTQVDLVERYHEAVLAWLADRTMVEAWRIGQACGVPCGPLFTVADLVANEHLAARGYWRRVEHQEMGEVTVPGPPFAMSASEWGGDRAAPVLGPQSSVLGSPVGWMESQEDRVGPDPRVGPPGAIDPL